MSDRKNRVPGEHASHRFGDRKENRKPFAPGTGTGRKPYRQSAFRELDRYMDVLDEEVSSVRTEEEDRRDTPAAPSQPGPARANLEREDLVAGRNPVREALRAGTPINKILIASGETDETLRRIQYEAREKHIQVQEADRRKLNQLAPAHQGVVAFLAAREYSSVEEILACAQERGEPPFIVVLDGITDPHNLGAIIRSAECAGAHGVILAQNRAVGLTSVVEKAAAGALQWMKVAKVVNISRTLESLKKQGIWCYAASMDGDTAWGMDFRGPVALVIGDEGKGISRLVMENCDYRVSIPMRGHIGSLNASAAACVLLYEVLRSRTGV